MVSSVEPAFASSTAARSVHAAPPVSQAVLVVGSDVSSVLCTAKFAACAAVARKSAETSAIAQVKSARASPERCIEFPPVLRVRRPSGPEAARYLNLYLSYTGPGTHVNCRGQFTETVETQLRAPRSARAA